MNGTNTSYWVASTAGEPGYAVLDDDLDVDVAVIGAGIVGVTAAYLLQREGRDVAMIEMARVAGGATGYTTAKLTSGHNVIYKDLEKGHGREAAENYARANQAGLELVTRIVEEEAISCDFERKTNYVYVESHEEIQTIESEAEACHRAGLKVDVVKESTLPYEIAAAIALEDQAQFHPRKYLLELARRFSDSGGRIFEHTRALKIGERSPCTIETDHGRVRAQHVVLATHYPFIDRALLFPRVHPKRSYAVAGVVPEEMLPDGMFISSDEPTRSVRTIRDGDRTLLLVGGEGHAVGHAYDTEACYDKLSRWARDRFEMSEPEYRWSTQDGVSVDKIPFIGTYRPGGDRIFVATGFGKWGLTNGTIGAQLIVDQIRGDSSPYQDLFDPKRLAVKASTSNLLRENSSVAGHWVRDRILHPQRKNLDDLAPGEAGVDRRGLGPVAAFRDEDGVLHKLSAVCTHLLCTVTWNGAERSWDCPCHGSRFDFDGRVLEGPATKDLKKLN